MTRSDGTRLTDTRQLRLALAAALALALAVVAAGCGGGGSNPSVANLATKTSSSSAAGASTNATAAPGAGGQVASAPVGGSKLAGFASCMRTHGVPSFPDPNAQGAIAITAGSTIDPNSPAFQKAAQGCQKLLPNGGAPTPAQQEQIKRQALAFSACMRAHGLASFPDPSFGTGGRVSVRISVGQGIDPNSPIFQAAQTACQKNLPGPRGPGGGPGKGAGGFFIRSVNG